MKHELSELRVFEALNASFADATHVWNL